jgi:hypothetical protein
MKTLFIPMIGQVGDNVGEDPRILYSGKCIEQNQTISNSTAGKTF